MRLRVVQLGGCWIIKRPGFPFSYQSGDIHRTWEEAIAHAFKLTERCR